MAPRKHEEEEGRVPNVRVLQIKYKGLRERLDQMPANFVVWSDTAAFMAAPLDGRIVRKLKVLRERGCASSSSGRTDEVLLLSRLITMNARIRAPNFRLPPTKKKLKRTERSLADFFGESASAVDSSSRAASPTRSHREDDVSVLTNPTVFESSFRGGGDENHIDDMSSVDWKDFEEVVNEDVHNAYKAKSGEGSISAITWSQHVIFGGLEEEKADDDEEDDGVISIETESDEEEDDGSSGSSNHVVEPRLDEAAAGTHDSSIPALTLSQGSSEDHPKSYDDADDSSSHDGEEDRSTRPVSDSKVGGDSLKDQQETGDPRNDERSHPVLLNETTNPKELFVSTLQFSLESAPERPEPGATKEADHSALPVLESNDSSMAEEDDDGVLNDQQDTSDQLDDESARPALLQESTAQLCVSTLQFSLESTPKRQQQQQELSSTAPEETKVLNPATVADDVVVNSSTDSVQEEENVEEMIERDLQRDAGLIDPVSETGQQEMYISAFQFSLNSSQGWKEQESRSGPPDEGNKAPLNGATTLKQDVVNKTKDSDAGSHGDEAIRIASPPEGDDAQRNHNASRQHELAAPDRGQVPREVFMSAFDVCFPSADEDDLRHPAEEDRSGDLAQNVHVVHELSALPLSSPPDKDEETKNEAANTCEAQSPQVLPARGAHAQTEAAKLNAQGIQGDASPPQINEERDLLKGEVADAAEPVHPHAAAAEEYESRCIDGAEKRSEAEPAMAGRHVIAAEDKTATVPLAEGTQAQPSGARSLNTHDTMPNDSSQDASPDQRSAVCNGEAMNDIISTEKPIAKAGMAPALQVHGVGSRSSARERVQTIASARVASASAIQRDIPRASTATRRRAQSMGTRRSGRELPHASSGAKSPQASLGAQSTGARPSRREHFQKSASRVNRSGWSSKTEASEAVHVSSEDGISEAGQKKETLRLPRFAAKRGSFSSPRKPRAIRPRPSNSSKVGVSGLVGRNVPTLLVVKDRPKTTFLAPQSIRTPDADQSIDDGDESHIKIPVVESTNTTTAAPSVLVDTLQGRMRNLKRQTLRMEREITELVVKRNKTSFEDRKELEEISDAKQTIYSEMKSLLIQQNEETERLQHRVVKLEQKWRKTRLTALAGAIVVSLFLILTASGVALVATYVGEDEICYADEVDELFWVDEPAEAGQNRASTPPTTSAPAFSWSSALLGPMGAAYETLAEPPSTVEPQLRVCAERPFPTA